MSLVFVQEGFLDSDVPQKGADLFYAGQIEDEQNEMEDWKPVLLFSFIQ